MSVLSEIASEIRVCTLCELARRVARMRCPVRVRKNAEVFFIGEGPGWHEDQQGVPFVGASGKFLTELIERAGLSRDTVFITNVVKCRPPGNRDPLPDEMEACAPYLNGQIEAIDPLVVVTLGRFSMSRYFPNERISRIHGQPKKIGQRTVVPMYHPAAALHQGSLRGAIVEDFEQLGRIIEKARAERDRASVSTTEAEPNHEQMKLF